MIRMAFQSSPIRSLPRSPGFILEEALIQTVVATQGVGGRRQICATTLDAPRPDRR
jgi:hypothetical protein